MDLKPPMVGEALDGLWGKGIQVVDPPELHVRDMKRDESL
jgi:hypothetical protein